jgi:hypothetical protein
MNLKPCKEYEEALSMAAAGASAVPESEGLQNHLRTCSACSADFDRLERIALAMQRAVSPVAQPAPPQTLHDRVMTSLRAEARNRPQRPGQSWAGLWQGWLRSPRTAWSLAGSSVALVAILLAVRRFDIDRSAEKPTAVVRYKSNVDSPMDGGGSPAGPLALRRALARSWADFEVVLRQNDRILAKREPMAVPLKTQAEAVW